MRNIGAFLIVLTVLGCESSDPFVPGEPTTAVVARVDVAVESGELLVGDTTSAFATAYAVDGRALALVDFVWASADTSVVSVAASPTGERAVLTAVALGSTTVTARVGGVVSDPAPVAVVEPEPPPEG